MTLTEVLYVPELGTNLNFCRELGRVGIRSIFDDCECILKDSRDSFKVIECEKREGEGLYVLYGTVQDRKVTRAMMAFADFGKFWRRPLTHLIEKTVEVAIKNQEHNYCKLALKEQNECEVFPQASLSKNPFKGTLTHRGVRIESVIHSDIAGSLKVSARRGENYIASFIDCKSRSSEEAILKNKSYIYEKFEDFRVRFERANDCKIKAVHSDDGTEFEGL